MKSEKNIAAKLEDLSCLYAITKELARSVDLRDCLEKCLTILDDTKHMKNGTVTIINHITGQLEIEVARGITPEGKKRGKYDIGEGITGRVVDSSKPIIVPAISDEPLFLNKTKARSNLTNTNTSFLCVPIIDKKRVIGALSVDKNYQEGLTDQADADIRFLIVLTGLIAQATKRMQGVKLEKEALKLENIKLKKELSNKHEIKGIIGNSSRMQNVFEMVNRVVDSNATVLLRGESGTGKTLIAKAIHFNSQRNEQSFVVVNCSALPETLLESELFGHEKGAFTGATERKIGRFEQAEKGTLFLDEIGDISLSVQVKLLHAVQEKTFQRLGSGKNIKCDVRLVTATNRNLEKAVEQQKFREDLYYRLNVFPIYMPPLKERRTDILLLAEFFLNKFSTENNQNIKRISTSAIDMLMQYHWPGNIRELQNCMERAVLICDGEVIKAIHLPPTLQTSELEENHNPLSLAIAVENFEKDMIIEGLKANNGNQTQAAKQLDTSLRIINYKIHKYNIEPKNYKI